MSIFVEIVILYSHESVRVNPNWSLDVLGEQLRERGQLHNSPFSPQRFILERL